MPSRRDKSCWNKPSDVMKLEIVSAKETVVDCDVTSVVLPGLEGSFGVLPGHTPFLSILRKGRVTYVDSEEKSLMIAGGFVEVKDNKVCICLID